MADRTFRAFVAAAICGVFLVGCTSEAATPTSTAATTTLEAQTTMSAPTTSNTSASTSTSTTSSSSESPTVVSSSDPVVISVPSTIATTDQEAVDAAIAAYRGKVEVSNLADQDPSQDWESEIRKYSGDPYAASAIASLKRDAESGTRIVGQQTVEMTVLSVAPGEIVIQGCVDNTAVQILDKDGNNVKAPDQPGSYWRFIQKVTLYKHSQSATGWLVSLVESDLGTTC